MKPRHVFSANVRSFKWGRPNRTYDKIGVDVVGLGDVSFGVQMNSSMIIWKVKSSCVGWDYGNLLAQCRPYLAHGTSTGNQVRDNFPQGMHQIVNQRQKVGLEENLHGSTSGYRFLMRFSSLEPASTQRGSASYVVNDSHSLFIRSLCAR